MIRLPELVQFYLSVLHLPVQPSMPLIGPSESRWRHGFFSGLAGVPRAPYRPPRVPRESASAAPPAAGNRGPDRNEGCRRQ